MRVTVSAETSVPLDEAWAWWTDFGEPGEEMTLGHGMGKSRRRILSRDEAGVVFDDELPLPGRRGVRMYRHEVRFLDGGHSFVERGEGAPDFEAQWRFEATPQGGTRIVRELEVKSALMDKSGALGERLTRRMAEKDLQHHVRELEQEKGKR